MNIPDRLLFGQFLIEKRKINKAILDKALETQKKEDITEHPRMLGSILFNDFNIFQNRVELQRYLKEFNIYKEQICDIYVTAKTYGVSATNKLKQEYADFMEELETAPTTKIRDLIKIIEKFKLAIKQVKKKDEEIEELKKEVEHLNEIINKQNSQVKRINGYVKQLKNKNK